MKIVWGIGCIAFAVVVSFILAVTNLLLVDCLYALLAGSLIGTLFMIAIMVHGVSSNKTSKILFFALIGSVIGFGVAWVMASILSLNLIGNAALAFDLFSGVVGASIACNFFLEKNPSVNEC